MKSPNKKVASITAIKLNDTARDNYISDKYSALSQKSELVKNAISVGFEIEEKMPFLHKLILLSIEQNQELTAKDIEAVFLIDKKYSIIKDNGDGTNEINKHNAEPISKDETTHLAERDTLPISTTAPKFTVPDILKNIAK